MILQEFWGEHIRVAMLLFLGRVGLAFLYVLIAIVATYSLPRMVRRSVFKSVALRYDKELSEQRYTTIERLLSYLTRTAIFVITAVAILHLFVDSAGIFTFLGLFTAAIGFSIRNIVGDYVSGVIFLFEDQFVIGDDVEIGGHRGVVTDVTLRHTVLQAESGDMYIVPNGEIRVVRNYTRSDFSLVRVEVQVKSEQLDDAVTVLEQSADQFYKGIPTLIEPPRIVVQDAVLGATMTVAVLANARPDQEAKARGQLLAMIRKTLNEHALNLSVSSD